MADITIGAGLSGRLGPALKGLGIGLGAGIAIGVALRLQPKKTGKN